MANHQHVAASLSVLTARKAADVSSSRRSSPPEARYSDVMSDKPAYNVYLSSCPTRKALDRIADKWTALIIGLLDERPHRFGELRRSIQGISHKVLTSTLRSLETDGLINRRVMPTSPVTVEYSLTPLGKTLSGPLAAIRDWAEQHIDAVLDARAQVAKSAL
jgi:DNA-binding HxlR family transcriptional regulator